MFPINIRLKRKPAISDGAKGKVFFEGFCFLRTNLTGICITDPIIRPNIMKVYPNHPPSNDKASMSLKSPDPKPPLLIIAVTIKTKATNTKETIAEAKRTME